MKPSPKALQQAAANKRAMKAQQKLRPGQKMKVASAPRNGRGSSINCATSGNYNTQNAYDPRCEYLAMVCQSTSGDWRYVRVMDHAVDLMNQPYLFDASFGPELMELWKRIVIDNAIPWDDGVRADTLRIVRFNVQLEEITSSLFHVDEATEIQRRVALSKLSDDEARLLGLTHQKAKQKLLQDPEFGSGDRSMLKMLAQNITEYRLDDALRDLSAD